MQISRAMQEQSLAQKLKEAEEQLANHRLLLLGVGAVALGSIGYILYRHCWAPLCPRSLQDVIRSLSLSKEQLECVKKEFRAEMTDGLRSVDHKSSIRMIPTFVDRLPRGSETGSFYALDLGGTNFRVLKVRLDGGGRYTTISTSKFTIPGDVMRGTGTALFDFIADALAQVIKAEGTNEDRYVGFTFSFPVLQTALASGSLISWTKGFTASDVEGRDVVDLLASALRRRGVEKLKLSVLANDTVGTWATAAYTDPRCVMGIILGTGSNAAYVERIDNIKKWTAASPPSGHMLWGNFDSIKRCALPRTAYDEEVDRISFNPGAQLFEKMLSGLYLGEITRVALRDLMQKRVLLASESEPWNGPINTPHVFPTAYMSQIESDTSHDLATVKKILNDLKIVGHTLHDRRVIKQISRLVAKRSAYLCAVGIAAIVEQLGKTKEGVTVAIDGSVYELYPGFREMILEGLCVVMGSDVSSRISIVLSKDGSGVGAALLAALAQ